MNEKATPDSTKLENTRRKLIFRAGHRGTKEMDLILGTFALKNVPNFTPSEVQMFEDLLAQNDPDLYNWITGKEDVPTDAQSAIMDQLLAYDYAQESK